MTSQSPDQPLPEDVEAKLRKAWDEIGSDDRRRDVGQILRAFAREILADHHALGNWPNCPDCLRYYQQDYAGAVENARMESQLKASHQAAEALAEALEKALKAYETRGVLGKAWWTGTRAALVAYRVEHREGEMSPDLSKLASALTCKCGHSVRHHDDGHVRGDVMPTACEVLGCSCCVFRSSSPPETPE